MGADLFDHDAPAIALSARQQEDTIMVKLLDSDDNMTANIWSNNYRNLKTWWQSYGGKMMAQLWLKCQTGSRLMAI